MVLKVKKKKLLNSSFTFARLGDQVYIFDKMIFRLTFVSVILIFLFIVIDNGGLVNHFFYSCPLGRGDCQNPFWEGCSKNAFYSCSDINLIPFEYRYLGEREFITAGTVIGDRPGFLVNNFGLLLFLLLLNAFLFNHFTYNEGFIFKKFREDLSGEV